MSDGFGRGQALRHKVRTGEWAWFARAAVTGLLAPALMRLPLHRLDELGHRVARRPATRTPASGDLVRLVDAAIDIGAPLIRRRCTTRAVSLWLLMRRAGIDADLCFGIGSVAGRTEGHSWVATSAGPLSEPVDPRPTFTCVARLHG